MEGPGQQLQRARRHEILIVAGLVLAVLSLAATAWLTERAVVRGADAALHQKLDVYSGYIDSEVKRYALLPEILAASHHLKQILSAPWNEERLQEANAYLKQFGNISGAGVAYVMDLTGLTLAASNHDSDTSFVGQNYGFRPYFKDAAAGGRGRYIAVGATSRVPGYYISAPVLIDGRVAGVVAMKWALEALVPWAEDNDKVLITGPEHVVFAANDPILLFTRLDPLIPGPPRPMDAKQYGSQPLRKLSLHGDRLFENVRLVTLAPAEESVEGGIVVLPPEYAVDSRDIVGPNWRLIILSEVTGRTGSTFVNVITVALCLGLAALGAGYLNQRRRYMRSLYEAAIRDPLTRLYTRLYMNDVVGRMLEGHNRGGVGGVALVIFDVDHFKKVNDTYGHYVGDEVLVGVAAIVLEAARATDVPVRFGGEEVAVFLSARHLDDAVAFAERIRRQVEAYSFPLGEDEALKVTLSGGVALHRVEEPLSQLIIRADSALYEAKRAGRNRVRADRAEERVE